MYVDNVFDCLFFLMNFFNSDFIFFFEDGLMGDDNIDFGWFINLLRIFVILLCIFLFLLRVFILIFVVYGFVFIREEVES